MLQEGVINWKLHGYSFMI